MLKWFNKQDRLLRCLLLLIPGVNWFVELLIRWSQALKGKSVVKCIIAILAIPFGAVFGWIDFICTLLFNTILLAK